MIDLSSGQLQQSLAEAVSWCRSHAAKIDAFALRTARDRLSQAFTLREQAHNSFYKALGLSLFKTQTWRSTDKLLLETRILADAFRSKELKPEADLSEAVSSETRRAIAVNVIRRRSMLLGPTKKELISSGRILLYRPEENLACGAAQVSSLGFFDTNNVPPWDTWVDFVEGTLVSWVPDELVEIVDSGIADNPEECISWHD